VLLFYQMATPLLPSTLVFLSHMQQGELSLHHESQSKQGTRPNRPKKPSLLTLIQAWLRTLVVAIMRSRRSVTSRRGLEHDGTCLQTMRCAVLDTLVRHRFVGELTAVGSCVAILAHTHTIATVSIIIAVQRAFFPAAARSCPSLITSTLASQAPSVSAAACLAVALAVRINSIRWAFASNSYGFVVDCREPADTAPRTIVSARVWVRTIGSVDPLGARHTGVFLVTFTLT